MTLGEIFCVALFFGIGLAFVTMTFVGTFWGQAILDRQRRKRASQSPEEVWRELLAGRICGITVTFLVAGCVAGLPSLGPDDAWHLYVIAAIWCGLAIVETWSVSRHVARGWADVQGTRTAQRAHELVRQAREHSSHSVASGGEY